ncbi:hypothetical protein L4C37_02930 [Vibrio kagoshimensis]|uniref:hypothetical protein n=1 Tax=Vibrio kagoshimensis TaxID=2910244 RepID=UPI003D19D4D5
MKKTILALVIASASFTVAANVAPVNNFATPSSATMQFTETVKVVCGIKTLTTNDFEGSIKFNDEVKDTENFAQFELATNENNKNEVKVSVTTLTSDIAKLSSVTKVSATKLWIGEDTANASFTNGLAKSAYDDFAVNKTLKAIAVSNLDSTQVVGSKAGVKYTVDAVINVDCLS